MFLHVSERVFSFLQKFFVTAFLVASKNVVFRLDTKTVYFKSYSCSILLSHKMRFNTSKSCYNLKWYKTLLLCNNIKAFIECVKGTGNLKTYIWNLILIVVEVSWNHFFQYNQLKNLLAKIKLQSWIFCNLRRKWMPFSLNATQSVK